MTQFAKGFVPFLGQLGLAVTAGFIIFTLL